MAVKIVMGREVDCDSKTSFDMSGVLSDPFARKDVKLYTMVTLETELTVSITCGPS
jgi:hypothetical protein